MKAFRVMVLSTAGKARLQTITEGAEGERLRQLQRIVGGRIEFLFRLGDGLVLVGNEEGAYGLPPNRLACEVATKMLGSERLNALPVEISDSLRGGVGIFGNCYVFREDGDDATDLTDADVAALSGTEGVKV